MKKCLIGVLVIWFNSNAFSQGCIQSPTATVAFVSSSGSNCTYDVTLSVTTSPNPRTRAVRFIVGALTPVCLTATNTPIACNATGVDPLSGGIFITHTFTGVTVPCNTVFPSIVSIVGTTSSTIFSSTCASTTAITYTPFPVKLSYFKGFANPNEIALIWQTEAETNSSHFVVQRSGNAKEFGDLETIKSAGESTNKINYQYLDKSPLAGINYYRLLQIDKDGSITHSKIIDINSEGGASELIIYPNPSAGKFILKSNEPILSAEAFNASSQAVEVNLEKNADGNFLNFKNKPISGFYYLRVKTQTKAANYRVVVE